MTDFCPKAALMKKMKFENIRVNPGKIARLEFPPGFSTE